MSADGRSSAPVFYTVREAANILRCNKNTLYRAIREDAFPAMKIRSRLCRRRPLKRWCSEQPKAVPVWTLRKWLPSVGSRGSCG